MEIESMVEGFINELKAIYHKQKSSKALATVLKMKRFR
jgi:hypothetical protein